MTPTEINQAISEVCPNLFSQSWGNQTCGDWEWSHNGHWERCVNGNIFDDLNAMNKAEHWAYVNNVPVWNDLCRKVMWHAAAPQRAEAFLRTIGKWKE